MSDNKFIQRLKGKQTPKSVVEVQNDKLVAPFTGVPYSTDVVGAIIDDKDSSVVVAKGAQNWKLDGSSLVAASSLTGDGADYTGEFNASGSGLWINATYSLPAAIFNAGTKWVLKLCGKNLLTTSGETIGFTLVVKVGNTHITSKAFTVAEGANVFCRQLVIDFSESEQAVIKAQSGDSLTVQLLCADANASATIYNGMTILTALQRRVDSDAVASDTSTFDDLETRLDNIETELGDTFVKTDGTSIMTAPLKFAAGSMRGAVGPYLNGVSFWKMTAQNAITNIANITDSQFLPVTTNSIDLGRSANKWKDLYLAGKAYVATINNGADIAVPTTGGTFALLSDLDTKQDLLVAGDNIVMSSLPVGYKRLNYIESSGTQSINTNVAVNLGNSFELDCAFLSGNVSDKHMISQGNNSLRIGATNMTWFSQAAHFMAGFTVGQNLKIECGLNYLTVNGTSITGTTDSDTVGGTYAYLFGKNDGSAYCLARVKSAKIYNSSNVLVFDGIPALRESDSAVGLYDNVSGSFFGSTTADNFIAGDVVGSVTISAVVPDALPDQTGNSGKFLTTNGTTPSWATVDALPSQTGQSGKFLTTDGTDASWSDKPLVNTATGTNSLTILGDATAANTALNIGPYSTAEGTNSLAIGPGTGDSHRARATHANAIAIGYDALALAIDAIQLGTGQGTTQGRFKVWNYTMLDKTTGKIPIARLGDDTSTTQGNVLTLDSNGAAVWQAPSGGGSAGQAIDAKIVGTLTINDSVVSGFSNSNYLELPGIFDLAANDITSFEIGGKFTTPSNLTSFTTFFESIAPNAGLLPVGLALAIGNTQYNNAINVVIRGNTVQSFYGTTSLTPDTEYFIKLEYDGSDYKLWLSTNGAVYNLETTTTATSLPSTAIFCIGKSSFPVHSVNMDACYIKTNNVVIWQGMDAPGLHQRVPIGHEIIEFQAPTSSNNYTWYRKYADGWVEMGGEFTQAANAAIEPTITFPVELADTHYMIVWSAGAANTTAGTYFAHQVVESSKATTGCQVKTGNNNTTYTVLNWYVAYMAA